MFEFIYEYSESCICFLISLICLGQAYFFKKDFFSPANVYCFSQSITLGISYLKYNAAMTDFHVKTWCIWCGALISFFVGASCVRMFWKTKNLPKHFCSVKEIAPVNYNWKLHMICAFFVLFCYLLGVVGIVQVAGNLLLLTKEPSLWMTAKVDYGYWAILFNSSPLVMMFFGVAAFKSLNPHKGIRVLARVIIPIVFVINIFAYPNRGTLFFSLGVLLILFNYLKKKIPSAAIMLCLLVALGAFVGISELRSQYGTSVKDVAINSALDLPYKYVANNYWNLDYAVNPLPDKEIHPHTYGIDFFAGIFDYLRLTGSIRNSFGWDGLFNERVQKIQGLNTTGYLWDVYKDLYMPGVVFFPFFCGVALTLLHLSLSRKITPRNLLLYTMFIYLVAWWFFTPGYKQGIYWIWTIVLFGFTTLCSTKSFPEIPEEKRAQSDISG